MHDLLHFLWHLALHTLTGLFTTHLFLNFDQLCSCFPFVFFILFVVNDGLLTYRNIEQNLELRPHSLNPFLFQKWTGDVFTVPLVNFLFHLSVESFLIYAKLPVAFCILQQFFKSFQFVLIIFVNGFINELLNCWQIECLLFEHEGLVERCISQIFFERLCIVEGHIVEGFALIWSFIFWRWIWFLLFLIIPLLVL